MYHNDAISSTPFADAGIVGVGAQFTSLMASKPLERGVDAPRHVLEARAIRDAGQLVDMYRATLPLISGRLSDTS